MPDSYITSPSPIVTGSSSSDQRAQSAEGSAARSRLDFGSGDTSMAQYRSRPERYVRWRTQPHGIRHRRMCAACRPASERPCTPQARILRRHAAHSRALLPQRRLPSMVRLDLQIELSFESDEHGGDFVFNIHPAHTTCQTVVGERLELRHAGATYMHDEASG